jgi:hypothetical protein
MKNVYLKKLLSADTIIKIVIVSIALSVAYLFGYPSGKRLMFIGLAIIIFGFWWKWTLYWNYRSGAYLQEKTITIEEKIEKNIELTEYEQKVNKSMNIGPLVYVICIKLGLAILTIGFTIIIIK